MASTDTERIKKDIRMFYDNIGLVKDLGMGKEFDDVVEMSKLYAKDAQSYLDKGDLMTSFSCISYAHGLLDSVLSIKGVKKDV